MYAGKISINKDCSLYEYTLSYKGIAYVGMKEGEYSISLTVYITDAIKNGADCLTVDLGINVTGRGCLSPVSLDPALVNMIGDGSRIYPVCSPNAILLKIDEEMGAIIDGWMEAVQNDGFDLEAWSKTKEEEQTYV